MKKGYGCKTRYLNNTEPHLYLRKRMDKIGSTLVNTGTAPASGITLSFSDDVETRLLRSVDLAAGESITIEVGIRPGQWGRSPSRLLPGTVTPGARPMDIPYRSGSLWCPERLTRSPPVVYPTPNDAKEPATGDSREVYCL